MIAIVLACEVKAEPPIQVYLQEIEAAHEEYQIICWSPRSDSPLHQNPPGCIEFHFKKRDGSLKSRLVNYFRFRRFLIHQLRLLKPNKLVFAPTQAGVLLPKRFFRRYAGKYYFDYRDPGYENHRFYLRRVMNMVDHSFATALSSPGFLQVLEPSAKYIFCHNAYSFSLRALPHERKTGEPLIISSIGTLRTPEFAINEIQPFVNDARFVVKLYGTGDDRTISALQNYISTNHIFNVVYLGRFQDEELEDIIRSSDALLVYFLSKLDGLYHMPDRLYLGLQYGKPMVANADTYCAQYIIQNELGFALDPKKPDLDGLFRYLSNYDADTIYRAARSCLRKVEEENEAWRKSIRNFLKS